MLDLAIRGGTVVTSGRIGVCDLGIQDGTIVQIGAEVHGKREIDAAGKHVVPGGIDVHVHFTSFATAFRSAEVTSEDFFSGTVAAIAGGVTTVGNMTYQVRGQTLRDALVRDMAIADRDAAIDYILHPVLADPSPEAIAQFPDLAREGHTSLKIFMVLAEFDARLGEYVRAIDVAGKSGMITMLHCEDGPLIRFITARMVSDGLTSARHYADSRPIFTESVATERAVALAQATGAPVYIVHLSSAEALARCRRARASGVPLYVETRPIYLFLTRELFERPDGAKYVGNPPLREEADVQAIWDGLRDGHVDTIGSDHVAWSLSQKLDPSLKLDPLDVGTFRPGLADVEMTLPLLYSEGIAKGRITLNRFVDITATNPARLFGMYPRKGAIAVGADADLVAWDPDRVSVIDGSKLVSRADYSVYDGWEIRGRPAYVITRGEVVLEGGELNARRGRGRLVPRGRTEPL